MKTYTVEGLSAADVDLIALALDAYTSNIKTDSAEEQEAHCALLLKFDSLTDPDLAEQPKAGTVTLREGNILRVSFGRENG